MLFRTKLFRFCVFNLGIHSGFFGNRLANVIHRLAVELHRLQASALTASVTQIAQEVTANFTTTNDFDFFNQWAVQQEAFLNTNA